MISKNVLITLIMLTTFANSQTHALEKQTTLSVSFEESAPKDIFTLQNTGPCTAKALQLKIDLSSSKSGLIFDPTASGAGVNVFQPLEIKDGHHLISSVSTVRDGDQTVTFSLKPLSPDAVVSFAVDVDDTLKQGEFGQTMISGTEMQGAAVVVEVNKTSLKSFFSADAEISIARVPCA